MRLLTLIILGLLIGVSCYLWGLSTAPVIVTKTITIEAPCSDGPPAEANYL